MGSLRDYADFHASPASRVVGGLGALLLWFGVLALFSFITIGAPGGYPVHLGHVALALVLLAYLRFSFPFTLFLAPVLALAFPFAAVTPRPLVIALTLLGALCHVTAPFLAGRRPGTTRILFHAPISPLFFAALLLGLWPMRRAAMAL